MIGNIARDIETHTTQGGVKRADFTLAVNRQFKNAQGQREADFIECQAWRQTAEFVSRYFQKGSAITVDGSLRNNNFEDKNGVKHYGYVVMADNVGFGGSKSDNQQTGQQTPQFGSVHAPQDNGLNLGDLGDFEEIISDGDTPF